MRIAPLEGLRWTAYSMRVLLLVGIVFFLSEEHLVVPLSELCPVGELIGMMLKQEEMGMARDGPAFCKIDGSPLNYSTVCRLALKAQGMGKEERNWFSRHAEGSNADTILNPLHSTNQKRFLQYFKPEFALVV